MKSRNFTFFVSNQELVNFQDELKKNSLSAERLVNSNSINEATTSLIPIIVGIGGGVGISAIINSLSKTIIAFFKSNPSAEVALNDDGKIINLKGYSLKEIKTIFEYFNAQNQSEKLLVKAFGNYNERILDILFNPIDGTYSAPDDMISIWNQVTNSGTKSIPITPLMKIAIIDTGIMQHHPYIKGSIIESIDFTGEGINDYSGHGTLVTLQFLSGWMAFNKDVRPQLYNIKVIDKNGLGNEENFVKGIDWAIENKVDTINLSLGIERESGCSTNCRVCKAVEKAIKENITVVAAAGNNIHARPCPTMVDGVLRVGSANDGVLENYSSSSASLVSNIPKLKKIA